LAILVEDLRGRVENSDDGLADAPAVASERMPFALGPFLPAVDEGAEYVFKATVAVVDVRVVQAYPSVGRKYRWIDASDQAAWSRIQNVLKTFGVIQVRV